MGIIRSGWFGEGENDLFRHHALLPTRSRQRCTKAFHTCETRHATTWFFLETREIPYISGPPGDNPDMQIAGALVEPSTAASSSSGHERGSSGSDGGEHCGFPPTSEREERLRFDLSHARDKIMELALEKEQLHLRLRALEEVAGA